MSLDSRTGAALKEVKRSYVMFLESNTIADIA